MFDYHISDSAWNFIDQVLKDYDYEYLPLLKMTDPGTIHGQIRFDLIHKNSLDNNLYLALSKNHLKIYYLKDQEDYLAGLEIDYAMKDLVDGHLEIDVPLLYGDRTQVSLRERIEHYISKEIQPALDAHKGKVQIEELSDDGILEIRFAGGCQGCSMASVTLKNIFEEKIRKQFPEIQKIIDVTAHSEGKNPYA